MSKQTKPTKKRLKFLIADEKKASKEYKRYGYTKLSKDEASHRKFLKKKYNAIS